MKVILVGHGYFGRIYREHLDKHDKFSVVGVCDTNLDRLDLLKSQTVAPTYEMMADSVEHDAVVICAPPHEHADLSIKAMQRNKHVLCMKPGAMSLTEYELVSKSADDAVVAYSIDFTNLHAPEYQDLYPSGCGKVTSISAARHVAGPPKPEGIILDLLSHDIAFFDDVFWGEKDIRVSCSMLDGVTAALTINDADDQRLMYAVASYNATHPKKETMFRIKPHEPIANPILTKTWNHNQRFVKLETQGKSVEFYYRHEPDPITRALDAFYDDVLRVGWCGLEWLNVWRIMHAAMHSAEHDGMLVRVEK